MMKIRNAGLLIFAFAVVIFFATGNGPLQAASFACDGVKQPFAVTLCSDPELSGLDSAVGEKYRTVRDALSGPLQLELIDNQVNWFNTIKGKCRIPEALPFAIDKIPAAAQCLRGLYQERLEALDRDHWHDLRAHYESGLTTDTRVQLQQRLVEKGYYQDKVDGRFGPKFRLAVAKAQRALKLKGTGFVDKKMLDALDIPEGGEGELANASLSLVPEPIVSPDAGSAAMRPIIQLRHSGRVGAVAFSPNGRLALSGGNEGSLKLWEVATGREVRTIHPKYDVGDTGIDLVTFSPDGRLALFATHGGYDGFGEMRLLDVATGKELRTFIKGTDVSSAVFSPDGRFALAAIFDYTAPSGAENRIMKLWDVATGKEVRTFTGHADDIEYVAFSADGRYILSGIKNRTLMGAGKEDGALRLWEAATGKKVRIFPGHSGPIAFSPDGRFAVSGGENKTLKLLDLAAGKDARTYSGYNGEVDSLYQPPLVTFSPDGRLVLSGRADSIKLWEAATGKEIRTFSVHSGEGHSAIAFSPDARFALCGDKDGSLRLWDLARGNETRIFAGASDPTRSVAFSPDGQHFISGSSTGNLNLWEATGQEIRIFTGHARSVNSVAFSPDGHLALSGSSDETLKLWDVATGNDLRTFAVHEGGLSSVGLSPGGVSSVAFAPNGRFALSGNWQASPPRLWNLATGKEQLVFDANAGVYAVAFSPDGRFALSGSGDGGGGSMDLLDVATGKALRTFVFPNGGSPEVHAVAFSPDGLLALSGGQGGGHFTGMTLWEVGTGKLMRTFEAPKLFNGAEVVAFSPDGHDAFSVSENHTLKLWDLGTGKTRCTLQDVSRAVFSPDGRRLLATDTDGAIRIWDLASGQWIARMVTTTDGEWSIDTPDGYYDTSPEGKAAVHYATNFETYGFEQFESLFRRPDIIRARLAGDLKAGTPAPALTIPPRIAAVTTRAISSGTTDKTTYPLSVVATSRDDLVQTVRVFVNGKPALETPVAAKEKRLDLDIPLFAGPNRITAVAYDGKGLSSNQETIDVVSTVPDTPKPTLWVLGIGVSAYPHIPKMQQLDYAHSDAKALVQVLRRQRGRLFQDVRDLTLTNQEATPQKIDEALTALGAMNANDVAVIFMAGHGVRGQDGRFWFVTPTGSLAHPENGGLDWTILGERIAHIKGRTILFLDACHSGSVVDETIVPNDQLAARFFKGGMGGVMVFSASKGRQASLEGPDIGGGFGAFTYGLTQALGEKAREADRDNNGFVEFTELVDYVSKFVNTETQGQQTPWLSRKELFGDLAIAAVKAGR